MKYKIIENYYIDKYGNQESTYYSIKIKRSFLFFSYWILDDNTYNTIEQADSYITNVLKENKKPNQWNTKIVSIIK